MALETPTKPCSRTQPDSTTWKEAPKVIVRGLLMGSADMVPGVSGGTMALITGIYTRLIDAIKSVDAEAIGYLLRLRLRDFLNKVHWRFLLSLLTGIILAVLFFTRVISLPVLIFTHPEPIYGSFFGMIVGSVILLLADIWPINFKKIIFLIIGTAIGWWVVTLVPTQTTEDLWFIFLSGALAICAMILPGISGSFILLILGKYSYIFGQLNLLGGPETTSAFLILAVFGLGIITGISAFSRFLSWLLSQFHMPTMCVLIGFLIGSLVVIWPWQDRSYETIEKVIEVANDDPRLISAYPPGSSPWLPEYFVHMPAKEEQAQLLRVQKKIVHSEPVWPDSNSSISFPLAAMVLGLLLVLVVGWMGKKAQAG